MNKRFEHMIEKIRKYWNSSRHESLMREFRDKYIEIDSKLKRNKNVYLDIRQRTRRKNTG